MYSVEAAVPCTVKQKQYADIRDERVAVSKRVSCLRSNEFASFVNVNVQIFSVNICFLGKVIFLRL